MQGSSDGRRTGFAIWLRTGRWPDRGTAPAIERKFNPWHDPEDGRFTFAGTGRHYGSGGQGRAARPASPPRRKPTPRADVSGPPLRRPIGGSGSFGGGGASGSWGPSGSSGGQAKPRPKPVPRSAPAQPIVVPGPIGPRPSVRPAPARPVRTPGWRKVERNGYHFSLDENGDPHKIEVPDLSIDARTPRSRSAQRNAGKPDRLPTDDGGHFIAHRFNGPRDAFNHFAQDASINRGKYRVLEQKWFDAKAKGKPVSLAMDIVYPKGSRRPDRLLIWYNIGGRTEYAEVPNRPSAIRAPKKRKGKRK
jgi:hypothetical protein